MKSGKQNSIKNTGAERSPNQHFFQPKLTVNTPGDAFEQEADAMADRVMRMPAAGAVQHKCAACEHEEEEQVHRTERGGNVPQVDAGFEAYVSGLGARGNPLSVQERGFFEPKFNRDFSNVRIHTDSQAARSAQGINALAYTSGNHIVFNSGQYQPESDSGKRLLAHELTHVVQQSSDIVKRQDDSGEVLEALVDEGGQGRTFTPRGTSRSGEDLGDRVHAAMDVPGPRGALVYCPVEGVVIFAGAVRGYGNLVSVFHENPPETELAGTQSLTSHYAHLDSINVSRGQSVGRQSVIGTMGNTTADANGDSGRVPPNMGVHLHFSVLRMNGRRPVARLSSWMEERLAIRPDTWLSQLGVGVARRVYRSAAPQSSEIRRTPLPETTRNHRDPRPFLGRSTAEMHQRIATNYRRYLGMPESEFDEDGMRQAWSDSRLIYHTLPRLTQTEVEALVRQTVSSSSRSPLPAERRRAMLSSRSSYPELEAQFNAVVAMAMDIALSFPEQGSIAEAGGVSLLETMTRIFILDPSTSSLDLLPHGQGERFRDFSWERNDYPGGTRGANEHVAVEMARELSAIRPERRANIGANAVVTRDGFERDSSLRAYISNELQAIPDFEADSGFTQPRGHRLNRHALEAFLEMRDAALQDGVPLVVISSYRSPERARANAERSGNPSAVASFSAHTLGLAIDLRMSYDITQGGNTISGSYRETTTTPMQNVVDMRQSPIHKWLFIHGEGHGWFPYQNEPWHWEYNPEGFRETFLSGR